jgi:hypothetical protein
MCDQCDKLQEKISHYRVFLTKGFDPLTHQRIEALIADLERRKETIHCAAGSTST